MSVNVRIEAKRLPSMATRSQRDDSLKYLVKIFKRACIDAGIPATLEEKRFYTRKCDIRRRKREAKRRAPLLAENKNF